MPDEKNETETEYTLRWLRYINRILYEKETKTGNNDGLDCDGCRIQGIGI